MKKKVLLLWAIFQVSTCYLIQSQNNIILNFSAINNTQPGTLDHVWIKNLSKNCDTTLPPGVLTINLSSLGIPEKKNSDPLHFRILEATPNPVKEKAFISLAIPSNGHLVVLVTGINGQSLAILSREMTRGIHRFKFTPGTEDLDLVTFLFGGNSASIKLISVNRQPQSCLIEYIPDDFTPASFLKSTENRSFIFTPGDQLLLVGFSGTEQSGILAVPDSAQNIILQFAKNIPCPGLQSVTYEGKVYNTVQIRNQCWLKENLDIGNRIASTTSQTNNEVIEKYCFNDLDINCNQYGGLYMWNEMLKYNYQYNQLNQGICPGDWHLPSDLEWQILEGAVDGQYGIGNPIWYNDGYRGIDAAMKLKTVSGWENNGNGTDLFGFSALPGGHYEEGYFVGIGKYGLFWTSTESASVFAATCRNLINSDNRTYRDDTKQINSRSVRCLKN